jgi:hypothetical protein
VQFKQQLRELMSAIDLTTPHYIRCINPNAEKAPNKFNKDEVLRALPSATIERAFLVSTQHPRSLRLPGSVRSVCMCWGALRCHVALQRVMYDVATCCTRQRDMRHMQRATCATHSATCNTEQLPHELGLGPGPGLRLMQAQHPAAAFRPAGAAAAHEMAVLRVPRRVLHVARLCLGS